MNTTIAANLAYFDQLSKLPKKEYAYKYINTETKELLRSEITKLAWRYYKAAGYKLLPNGWSKAMKKAWEDAKHELSTYTYKSVESTNHNYEINPEHRAYWTKGS